MPAKTRRLKYRLLTETQVENTEAPAPVVGDLFGETAAAPAPKRKIRSRKHDAVLTVSILIGIGNKPFLRGSAAGLSWEQGLEMDFQEIGKWRWVAPDDLEEPIEVQVYRNDEDPDLSGAYRLEPGQKLEIKPSFECPDHAIASGMFVELTTQCFFYHAERFRPAHEGG